MFPHLVYPVSVDTTSTAVSSLGQVLQPLLPCSEHYATVQPGPGAAVSSKEFSFVISQTSRSVTFKLFKSGRRSSLSR